MKKILLLGTGGTIACKRTPDGLKPVITSEEILTYVPDSRHYCEIDSIQILNIDSTNIQPSHWLAVSKAIEEHYEEYDGFVITHGTDTMAYTAAALSYLIQNSPKPIVITGAQKPIDMENTDARTNLADSLRFASHDKAHGINIVFDGKVIVGTRAKKERAKSYNAFSSINYPYPAVIQDQKVIRYIPSIPYMRKVRFYHEMTNSVYVLKLIPGMTPDVLPYLFEHYDCIVIESFGVGGLPESVVDGFYEEMESFREKGKLVVMTTQVANEGSNMTVYEVGKKVKQDFNLLEAYDMTLESVITKMMWIMSLKPENYDEVIRLFYEMVNHDILFTRWKMDKNS